MYAPGKALKAGTWADTFHPSYPITGTSVVIDMNQPSPTWRQVGSLNVPRAYDNLTALADGTVLIVGGDSTNNGMNPATAVYEAELWSPTTEAWTPMASEQVPRLYHSTALLLPDGRVLVTGGGREGTEPDETNAEIYSPPYLFKGPRPTIAAAPSLVQYGTSFQVSTPDAGRIAKVGLARLGAPTHGFDQNQRYVPLTFAAGGSALTVQAPATGNVAPPGYYMLFIVDTNGVPSVASFARFPAAWEDTIAPTAPGNLTATAEVGSIGLMWQPSLDDHAVTAYNIHRSTSPGFTPTAANRITQTPGTMYTDSGLAPGTYYYLVTAQDAAGNVGPPSNITSATPLADTTPPTVSITSPAAGATVAGGIVVTADASDDVGVAGVQLQVDGVPTGIEDMSAPYAICGTRGPSQTAHTRSPPSPETPLETTRRRSASRSPWRTPLLPASSPRTRSTPAAARRSPMRPAAETSARSRALCGRARAGTAARCRSTDRAAG